MIYSPYRYNREEVAIIQNNVDWDSTECQRIKKNIRDHIFKEFEEECVYCKIKIPYWGYDINIEHIVHKSSYKNFTFRPENLAPCCKKCNTAKLEKDTLIPHLRNINHQYNDYPTTSDSYVIVHPYFDHYQEHIRFDNDIFVSPVDDSLKGIKTIEICDLTRLPLAEIRVKNLKIKFSDIITRAFMERNTEDGLDKIASNIEVHFEDIRKMEELEQVFSDKLIVNLADDSSKTNIMMDYSTLFLCSKLISYNTKIDQINNLFNYINSSQKVKNLLENYTSNQTNKANILELIIDIDELSVLKDSIQNNSIRLHPISKRVLFEKLSEIKISNFESRVISYSLLKSNEIESLLKVIKGNNELYLKVISLSRKQCVKIQRVIEQLDRYPVESAELQKRKFIKLMALYNFFNVLQSNSDFILFDIADYLKNLRRISKQKT